MLHSIIQLTRRDLWHLLRHPAVLAWIFVMPAIFFAFIGTVTSGGGPDPSRRDSIGVYVPQNAGFAAAALLRRLDHAGYEVRQVPAISGLAGFTRQLAIPEHFTDSILAAKPVQLRLILNNSGEDASYDQLRAGRATYGLLAELIASTRRQGAITAAALDQASHEPHSLIIDVKPAGERNDPPSGYQQSVPGTLVMFVLTIMLTSGGISLFAERRLGILRRLACTPMTRGAIVTSKWLTRFLLGSLQVVVGCILGTVLFHVEWGAAPWAAALLLVLYTALCGAVGVFLGSIARSEGQASAIGVVAGNLLAALGGCWWPAEVSPLWMQKVGLCLPTGIVMDGLHKVMSFQQPAAAILPHLLGISAMALVAAWLSARHFRFD